MAAAAVSDVNSWQSECAEVRVRLSAMLTRGLWTDCELAAGAGDAAERVPAHRVLLASASPVFAAMLYGSLPVPRDQPLPLPDVEPRIARLLLEYIYTDNIVLDSCDVACSLYRTSHFLLIPHLAVVCKTYLENNVSPESALRVYEFAQLFDENALMEKCVKVMGENTSSVLESVGTTESPQLETLVRLFALPELNIQSELELLQAADRWARQKQAGDAKLQAGDAKLQAGDAKLQAGDAKFQAEDAKLQAGDAKLQAGDAKLQAGDAKLQAGDAKLQAGDAKLQAGDAKLQAGDAKLQAGDAKLQAGDAKLQAGDAKLQAGDAKLQAGDALLEAGDAKLRAGDTRTLLRPALQQIRFLVIDPDEFTQCHMSPLLSQSELLAISFNLLSIKSYLPMPNGFTTSREPRQVNKKVIALKIPVQPIIIIESDTIYVHGLPWQLNVSMDVSEDEEEGGIDVDCNWNSRTDWQCDAKLSLKVRHPKQACFELIANVRLGHG